MSGPKSSRYTLTPEQRKALAEQREREQKSRLLRRKLNRIMGLLNELPGGLAEAGERASQLARLTGSDLGWEDLSHEWQEKLRVITGKILGMPKDIPIDQLRALEQETMQTHDAMMEQSQKLLALDGEIRQKLERKMEESIHSGFSLSFEGKAPASPSGVREDLEKMLEALSRMELSPELRERITQAKHRLGQLRDEKMLKNFRALTLNPLKKRCEEYAAEQKAIRAEYDRLLDECAALEIPGDPPAFPCTPSGIEEFARWIGEKKDAADLAAEQSYIREAMDQVMADMGYQLLGDRQVVKKSGKTFRNKLYRFTEGTAVCVTTGSDGQITMELGGLDEEDRLPDPAEAAELRRDMEEFCHRFAEFEQRLRAKGVASRHISLLPPDEKYAQIINTRDFQMRVQTGKKVAGHRGKTEKSRYTEG